MTQHEKNRDQVHDSEDRAVQYVANVALEQLKRLGAAVDALDTKTGVLLGLTALAVLFSLEGSPASGGAALGLLFTYTGTAALLASMVLSILSIVPMTERFDPDVKNLVHKYIDAPTESAMRAICGNLGDAWEFNKEVLQVKSRRLCWALWLLIIGIGILALGRLVIVPLL